MFEKYIIIEKKQLRNDLSGSNVNLPKEDAMKDHSKKGRSIQEQPTSKSWPSASDNFQIEYVGGKYFKLVGSTRTEFTPDRELLSKMMDALRKKGMTLDDIADDQLPVDFQVLSSGKVVLRQITPDKWS